MTSQNYWLDPTADFERGALAARGWPDYKFGLVIRPRTAGLAVIPESPVQPKTTVMEYAFLRGLGQSSDLKIVTLSEGPDADAMRRRFATTDHAAIAAEDLNAFAALYPGITSPAPLQYTNDDTANQVMVTEYYQIPNIWSPVPAGPGYVCRFYSYNIDRAARKPLVSVRSMPLGLNYPEHQVFLADISFQVPIPANPNQWIVDDPAFHFHKAVARSPGKVLLEEEYFTRADAVPVEAIPGYLQRLDQVSELLGCSLFSY